MLNMSRITRTGYDSNGEKTAQDYERNAPRCAVGTGQEGREGRGASARRIAETGGAGQDRQRRGEGALGEAQAYLDRPIVIDLCCGKGGWALGLIAAGFRVVGFDNNESFRADYPGEFYCVDIREIFHDHQPWPLNRLALIQRAALIVASPPCDGFSRHAMPWTRKRNPPPPDLSLVETCREIAEIAGVPLILENVREAQKWIGKAACHYGPFYLWGAVPALMPRFDQRAFRKKESRGSANKAERAMVPFELALHIGLCFRPVEPQLEQYSLLEGA